MGCAAPSFSPSASPSVFPSPSPSASPSPSPTASPVPLPVGADGRLTILLLGSDRRAAKPGILTDAMLVISVDAATGRACAASLPRDLVLVPLPDGGTFEAKLNGLYQWAREHPDREPQGAFEYLERTVGDLLGLEVDAHVMIGFEGVRRAIDALGGVDVVLDLEVRDPFYQRSGGRVGVVFPKGVNHLDGELALVFARTRKGDNDFERERRQQQLIAAVAAKVADGGLPTIVELLPVLRDTVQTDLAPELAPGLLALVSRIDLAAVERTVLGPRRYADAAYGPWGYGISPKVDAMRAWVAAHCGG